ncbi:MAG: diguanylate cyclase domain-containing protein, partial [Rhodanobacteraceae bacterium]
RSDKYRAGRVNGGGAVQASADQFKRVVLLAIIVLAVVGTLASWLIMKSQGPVADVETFGWSTTTLYLLVLFVVQWWRVLPQRVIDLACLLFTIAICAGWMVLCLYSPRYGGAVHIESLYLWIPVIYVFAFTLVGHKSSLAISFAILAVFVGIGLPYLVHDPKAPYANFTVQLYVVSAVLIAALYFFSSYQHRLRLAQLTVGQLAQLSNTDELTRLPNRRRMASIIGGELARLAPGGVGFAVMLVDLDHFKTINDRFGHAAGDAALVALTARTRELLRGGDTMGRWGGDEFVVLVPDINHEDVSRKAHTLCQHVAAVPLIDGHTLTISCGVATATAGDTCDSLLKRADMALYEAKRSGRNRAEGVWRYPARVSGACAATPTADPHRRSVSTM